MRGRLLLFLSLAVAGAFGACVEFQPEEGLIAVPEGGSDASVPGEDGAGPSLDASEAATTSDGSVLLGPERVTGRDDVLSAGTAEAFRMIASHAGTARRVRIFVRDGNQVPSAIVGLYTENVDRAGGLLGSGTVALMGTGWFEGPLTTPVSVEAGKVYWVAILNPFKNQNMLFFRSTDIADGGGPAFDHDVQALNALPGTWVNGGQNFGNAPASVQFLQ